jgi:SAM-dependent methyltransferase
MKSATIPDFASVTERPGQKATALQLRMLKARYGWAASQAQGADVLEAACGAGLGLDVLARVARSVAAGDLDEANLAAARETYRGSPRIALRTLDALNLPYAADSFDLVLLFEALYYLPSAARFFAEARRVLRDRGRLLIASVNPEWTGFHPSPYSVRYHTAAELARELSVAGFAADIHAGFPERDSWRDRAVDRLRRAAAAGGLIPRTMHGKALLKRMFYGRLERIPARLGPGVIQPEQMTPAAACPDLTRFRVLYAAARKVS